MCRAPAAALTFLHHLFRAYKASLSCLQSSSALLHHTRMLMTAALHMMDSDHGGHGPSPSSFTSPAPPWLLADDNTRRSRDHLLISSPSPAAAPPLNHHHNSLRPAAARGVSNKRRRPRPSRKLPTTYIAADPASFCRMVHHVTGADNLPLPPPPPVCRPAPSRAAAAFGPGALPTLDTSALFLLSGGAPPVAAAFAAAPALDQQEEEAGGVVGVGRPCCDYGSSTCGGGSFPTLDSFLPL